MPDANLLQKLKGNDAGLTNLLLFGRIRSMIKTPGILSYINPAEDGAFAILDVFAIKCLKFDHFAEKGSRTKDQIYNTKGSVIIYLNKPQLVGKYVKVSGRTAMSGVTVKQNKKHSHPSDGIVAFVWTKDRDKWLLEPNFVTELGKDDPNLLSVPFLDYVMKYIGENTEIEEYPVSNIMEFEAIRDYEELDPGMVKGIDDKIHHSDERLDLSKVDLKLTYHETGVELPQYFYDVKDEIDVQAKSRLKYAKDLVAGVKSGFEENAEVSLTAARNIRNNFISNVVMDYASNVGNSKVKGRFYLDEFLKCLTMKGFQDKEKMSEKEVNELKDKVLENPNALNDEGCISISDVNFASIVVGLSTGIGFDGLVKNYKSMKRVADISVDMWFYMLLSNPYLLSIMGSSVNATEADAIYYSYSKYFAVSIVDSRGSDDMRNKLLYLQALEKLSEEDSIVNKKELLNFPYHYNGSEFVERSRFMLKKDLVELLKVICSVGSIALSEKEVRKLYSDDWKDERVLNSLLDNGIVNTIDSNNLMIEITLEKEALIFEVFQKKGMQFTGITQEQCDVVCNEFEEKVGFKLEDLQKKGVGLIKYKGAVLTGCAGSGKTTTSDGMVMGLEKHLKGYKLVYCAPTGKAARRMAEVLNKMVKTVHSEFKISVGVGESYLSRVDRKIKNTDDGTIKGKIYLIDESGMLNRELLYDIARNLKDEDIVYFLGDIKQLPPIGTGCPFYNLMSILPCVELGVSKRAAEGSLINYNTTVINCLSDGVMEGILTDDSSFIAVDCSNEAIANNVLNLWKRFMTTPDDKGKVYAEDEIQVISAYAKPSCLYSSTALNPIIQKYLRRNDAHCFRHVDTDFFKNDRVIHANVNLYGMQRFVKTGAMQYTEVLPCGIVNGELGKVVGCYDSRMFTFEELDDATIQDIQSGDEFYENVTGDEIKELIDIRETYADKMSSISSYVSENTWLVDIEVYDVNLKRNVHVFYDGRVHNQDGIIMLTGGMLDNLELAYALTCHKMQGSQIPVALIPLGSDANPNFVNRNMLNTEITRSQKVVAMIGDITSNDSAFNKGRTKVARYRTESILTTLCEEARG